MTLIGPLSKRDATSLLLLDIHGFLFLEQMILVMRRQD